MFNIRMFVICNANRPVAPTTAALVLALFVCSACVRSETRDEGQHEATAPRNAHSGAIEGRIQYPGHVIPPMRICAIGSGAPDEAKRVCVQTRRDQASYRIEGVPADDYIVIAQTESSVPLYRVGGHVQQVQCIRAPCPEMPAGMSVGENGRIEGVDINQFYDKRDDFPALRPE
jgi:hypothetical protein